MYARTILSDSVHTAITSETSRPSVITYTTQKS